MTHRFLAPGFVPLLDWLESRSGSSYARQAAAWSVAVALYISGVFLGLAVLLGLLCALWGVV